jgi:uncharacterized glyoxalase superfamily protein PhnB
MSDGSILPIVRYQDPQAAADWLCGAYEFSVHHVAERPDGGVAYFVLRFGDNFVLVGPPDNSVFDDLMVQPADVGNRSTQTCYLTVNDVDQHFARARAAGARIEVEPEDDKGERYYMCRDPEGHLWAFGMPLAGATLPKPIQPPEDPRQHARGSQSAIGLATLVGLAIGIGAVSYLGGDFAPKGLASWVGGIAGQDASQHPQERERLSAFAQKRLADAEAVAADLTERLQASRFQFAETLREKERVERMLSESEAEYQTRLKDSESALHAALRAKDLASQELEAEHLRAKALQTKLDEASERLASLSSDGNKADAEARRLLATIAQLTDALRSSTQATQTARDQLAAAQHTERELMEKLHASERETAELRARVMELEKEKEAARTSAEQAADAAREAVAAAQANGMALRDKPIGSGGTLLSHHHLAQGKKWITAAAIDKGKPATTASAKPIDTGAQSRCSQAVRDLVLNRRGKEIESAQVVRRLCDKAHSTQEPAKCVARLLSGEVNWGGGTEWALNNALNLCARTKSAETTLSCFSRQISDQSNWKSAIAACAAS